MSPGPMPCISPSGISSVRPAREPTTSARTVRQPPVRASRPVRTSQTSPTSASRPVASTIRPMRSLTRPWRRCRSARATARPRPATRAATSASGMGVAELLLEDLAGAGQLGVQRGVDLALEGAHDRAAAADAPLGLDLAVLDAAELGDQRRRRGADELEVVGVDQHADAIALDEAAQRAAHDVHDPLGVDG